MTPRGGRRSAPGDATGGVSTGGGSTGGVPRGGGRASAEPLGGDWGSGERVFGPPRGTVESDWFVPLVREAHPEVSHEAARTAVRAAWSAVNEEASRAGRPAAHVDETSVRRLLGLAGTPAEAATTVDADVPSDADGSALLKRALTVVLAAARAYDDTPPERAAR